MASSDRYVLSANQLTAMEHRWTATGIRARFVVSALLCALSLGLAIVASELSDAYDSDLAKFRATSVHTTGTITARREESVGRGAVSVYTLEYPTPRGMQRSTQRVGTQSEDEYYSSGTQLKVLYDPTEPSVFVTDDMQMGTWEDRKHFLAFLLIAVAVLAFAALTLLVATTLGKWAVLRRAPWCAGRVRPLQGDDGARRVSVIELENGDQICVRRIPVAPGRNCWVARTQTAVVVARPGGFGMRRLGIA